jgi:hypothetical protein
MASNHATLDDGSGESSDWIELYNQTDRAIDLDGWHLTDSARNLRMWTFPRVSVPPGEFLVVFASGRNAIDDAGYLHTNFSVSKGGEFLALVQPDGVTLASHLTSFPEQFTDISFGVTMISDGAAGEMHVGDVFGFFDQPSPGTANPSMHSLGPQIDEVRHQPLAVTQADELIVSARVTQTLHAVERVTLQYQVMYGDTTTIDMSDDGQGADGVANDGRFTAVIPAGIAGPGQMIRYFVSAQDSVDGWMRSPRIVDTTGDDQSPQFYGTVVDDPAVRGELPIFSWFTNDVSGAHGVSGARASVFYDGEFYDNVFVRQRGAFTNADSQKFEFNDSQPFYVNPLLGRVPEINVNAQGDDGSYLRQPLAYESHTQTGAAASESFLMQLRVNGRFDRVGVYLEQVDQAFLERHALDPGGALYKFVQRENHVSSGPALGDLVTGVEKKSREFEDFSDLQSLIDGLSQSNAVEREAFLFDNLNLPQIINYLAVRTVVADADDTAKNFYLYRDTDGNGEWSILPWDKDRSFGEPAAPVTNRLTMTHPFLGQGGNRLYGTIFETPVTRDMYLRRLRSVMDQLLQSPDTPADQLRYESRIDQLFATTQDLLGPSVADEVATLKSFFPLHRQNLYVNHSIDRRTDLEQIVTIVPEFAGSVEYFVPSDNSLGNTWTNLTPPANVQEWSTGVAGIGFEDSPEVFDSLIRTRVNPADTCASCTSILMRIPFVVDNPAEIQDLTLRMKYDDGFVAYLNGVEVARRNVEGQPSFDTRAKGHLDSQAVVFENIVISEHANALRTGDNILALHAMNISPTNSDMLISPELVSGVFGDDSAAGIPHRQQENAAVVFGDFDDAAARGREEESFLELRNPNKTAVDLSGWRLSGAVDYVFQPGTVLTGQGRMFVSPDVTAFRQRQTDPKGGSASFVQGNYQGSLADPSSPIELHRSDGSVVAVLDRSVSLPGDFNGDRVVDVIDIQQLCVGMHADDPRFDLTGDQRTNQDDLAFLIQSILGTQFGDANLDGVFNSRDLVQIFQAGEYDDSLVGNSTWSDGDWNCDREFNSADLVLAFQVGGYTA